MTRVYSRIFLLGMWMMFGSSLVAQFPGVRCVTTVDGRFWIGTEDGGIVILDPALGKLTPLDVPDLPAKINDVLAGNDSLVYVATDKGLYFIKSGSIIGHYDRSTGIASDKVSCLALAEDGTLWLGTDRGVASLLQTTYRLYNREAGLLDNDVIALRMDQSGRVWALSEDGLSAILPSGIQKFSIRNSNSLAVDPSGIAYVGARDGLKVVDGEIIPINQMTDQSIVDVHIDPIGKVWLVSSTGGIFSVEETATQRVLQDVTASFDLKGQKPILIRSNPIGEKTVFSAGAYIFKPHSETDAPYRDHIIRLARENEWLGRWDQSSYYFEEGLKTFKSLSDSIAVLVSYARALHKLGRNQEAVRQIDIAAKVNAATRSDSVLQTGGLYLAGEILAGNRSEACVRYFEAVTRSVGAQATIEAAYWKLAQYYDSTSNKQQAVRWISTFADRFHASPRYWEAKQYLADAETDSIKYDALGKEIGVACTDLDVLYQFDTFYHRQQFQSLVDRYRQSAASTVRAPVIAISDTITCQASVGNYVWIGTTAGALKIILSGDGSYETLRYTADSGLADNRVNDLMIDRKGQVWFACGGPNEKGRDVGGLSKWDGIKWTTYGANNGIRGGRVNTITVGDDKIAVSTPSGVFVAKNNAYPYWTLLQKASRRTPVKLHLDNLGKLWIADGGEIWVENDRGFSRVEIEPADSTVTDSMTVYRFMVDEVGNKLATAPGGVYKYDGDRFKVLFRTASPDTAVSAFTVDPGGSVLLGSEAGFSKQTDLAVLRFGAEDSLPSPRVLDIFSGPSEKWVLTTGGMYRYKESPLDTVKLLIQLRENLDRMSAEKNYQRIRQICRQLIRVGPLSDYFTYELARSYEEDGKWLESLNYLTEYVKLYGKTDNFNEYAFFRIAVALERQGDVERADVLLRAMMRGFSSQTSKALIRLDDEELASYRLNWTNENNPYVKSVYGHLLHRAVEKQQLGQLNAALATYKVIETSFSGVPPERVQAQLQEYADDAGSGDRAARIKILKQMLKIQNLKQKFTILYELARTYHLAEQYRDAAPKYEEILASKELAKTADEIQWYLKEVKQRAELGLRANSGFSEVNSTNAMDFEGNYLWLGTSKGVIRWNLTDGSYKKFSSEDGLVSDYVYGMAIDSNGGKWFVGSSLGYNDDRGGVSYFDGEAFVNFTKAEGLASNKVRCVTIDHQGVVWVGTDAGVSSWKDGQWTNHDLRRKFDFSYVSCLTVDDAGRLWIGLATRSQFPSTTGGALIFDEINPTVFNEKTGLPSNNIKSISIADNQDVWFSTSEGVGIYSQADHRWRYINRKQKLSSNIVRGVGFANGQVWFATDQGLSLLADSESLTRGAPAVADNTAIRTFGEKEGLVTNDIRLIRYNPAFGTWVGSKRGSFSVGNFAGVESDEASQAYNKKLFEVSVESEAIFEKAQQFIEQGDFDKAREIYLDVLDRVSNGDWSDDAQFLLAKSYELEGNYAEAEKKYTEFVANNPQSELVANAYIGIGNVFEKQKKFDKAEEAFKKAEAESVDKSVTEQARILAEKVKVKKIASERAATEDMAQSLSRKYTELDKETGERRTKLLAEIDELEKRVNRSAKAGGFELKLYKVKEGESLWYLSQKFLGDPTKWRDFFIANEGKVTDPDLIVSGQTIVVLTLEKGQKEQLDKFLFYDVSPGEDLETIASKLYGSKDQWRVIYEANKEKVSASPKKSLGKIRLVIPVEE